MFGFNDMTGVILDNDCMNKLQKEEQEIAKIYFELCQAIINEDIASLKKCIPNKSIKNVLGHRVTKEKWLENIEKKNIKYYGIEILDITVNIEKNRATIKSLNKIRAKLEQYRGSWKTEGYLMLENENQKWIVKEIFI